MSGFKFHETMAGTWRPGGGGGGDPARAFRFSLDAHTADLRQFLRDNRVRLDGTVEAAGLAAHAPTTGEMTLAPLLGRTIAYEFRFAGDDGKPYRFHGRKDLTVFRPIGSITTLPGEILDGAGGLVGTALLRFDLRDLPALLASFRPLV